MTFARTLTLLTLTLAALASSTQAAQANDLQKFFRTARTIQRNFQTPQHQASPGVGLPVPPGYERPGCPPHVCPPPPPPRCVYYVYYLDCHRWELFGTFHSRYAANQAEWRLESQGYRTYTKMKHVGGYPGGPVH